MNLRIITPPSIEPVSLTEAKLHLRETQSEQDSQISALIQAAREYAENYTRRALLPQTLELRLEAWPSGSCIRLPMPPCISVDSIYYLDSDGALQLLDPSVYELDLYSEPARLQPAWDQFWPATRGGLGAIRVRYQAGYQGEGSPTPSDASGVPEAIKQWVKIRVAQMYEHREATIVGTIVQPLARDFIDGLLDRYVVDLFG